MIIPKGFKPTELAPKRLCDDKVWERFTEEAKQGLNDLRRYFSRYGVVKIICNFGKLDGRGLRDKDSADFRPGSQHSYIEGVKLCNGFDLDIFTTINGVTSRWEPSIVRKEILANQNNVLLKDIGGLEKNVDWVHIDWRPRVNGKILVFEA